MLPVVALALVLRASCSSVCPLTTVYTPEEWKKTSTNGDGYDQAPGDAVLVLVSCGLRPRLVNIDAAEAACRRGLIPVSKDNPPAIPVFRTGWNRVDLCSILLICGLLVAVAFGPWAFRVQYELAIEPYRAGRHQQLSHLHV